MKDITELTYYELIEIEKRWLNYFDGKTIEKPIYEYDDIVVALNLITSFNTQEDAKEWMFSILDDECIDNYRFGWYDDFESMLLYNEIEEKGCCGFFDAIIAIDGKVAMIGCNYGH